jgi:hypothetical protein
MHQTQNIKDLIKINECQKFLEGLMLVYQNGDHGIILKSVRPKVTPGVSLSEPYMSLSAHTAPPYF